MGQKMELIVYCLDWLFDSGVVKFTSSIVIQLGA